VTDGNEGLAWLDQHTPDLIVLDLMLPGMNGFELLRRYRGRGGAAAVLILSARDQEVDKVQGFRIGADDYVVKPVGGLELQARDADAAGMALQHWSNVTHRRPARRASAQQARARSGAAAPSNYREKVRLPLSALRSEPGRERLDVTEGRHRNARRECCLPKSGSFPPPDSRRRDKPSLDRKSTRLNSSHDQISYAVFCLKKKNKKKHQ